MAVLIIVIVGVTLLFALAGCKVSGDISDWERDDWR